MREHWRKLALNLVQYIADNVILMMLASSISMVGVSLIDKDACHPLIIGVIGVAISTALVLALRGLALCIQNFGGGASRAVAAHALLQLPWFVRVAMGSFSTALLSSIVAAISAGHPSDPCHDIEGDPCGRAAGESFLAFVGVFLVCLTLALRLVRALQHRPKFSSPEATTALFLGEVCYLCALTAASKALDAIIRLTSTVLRGTRDAKGSLVLDARHVYTRLVEQSFLTLIAVAILARLLPRLRRHASADELTTLVAVEYVIVYTWAFGLVDNAWWLIYEYGGDAWFGGNRGTAQLVFWGLLAALVALATWLAYASPDASFYEPRTGGRATSLLLFWAVDFCSWWGWYQVVLDVDWRAWQSAATHQHPERHKGRHHPLPGEPLRRSPRIIAINACCIVALLLLLSALYAANAEAARRASSYRKVLPPRRRESSTEGDDDDLQLRNDGTDPRGRGAAATVAPAPNALHEPLNASVQRAQPHSDSDDHVRTPARL